MKKKFFSSRAKDIVITLITAIASVQILVAVALFCNNWSVAWLPIQIGMLVLGIAWDVLFAIANFPNFDKGDE